jgi:hypothetical protein
MHFAARPRQDNLYLVRFNLVSSIVMLLGLHGTSSIKLFIILTMNYAISKAFRGSKLGPAFIWIFNGCVLFANDRYGGYRFGFVHPALGILVRIYDNVVCTEFQQKYLGLFQRPLPALAN